MGVRLAEVREIEVSGEELLALVQRPEAGATALFLGTVRNHDPQADGEVSELRYTAHPSAPLRIQQIVAEVLATTDPDALSEVACVHRIGRLLVGDNAFVVAVSAAHRRLAFEVCEAVVERVKAELPIWKQQFTVDGGYRWSNL